MNKVMNNLNKSRLRRRAAPPNGQFTHVKAADGAELRVACWQPEAGAAKGTIWLLHGRREFIEKYFETVHDLLDRGFAVATFDWRGQGLSQRSLPDRHRGHATDLAQYVEDVAAVVAAFGHCLPQPYAMLAHSFGGHCAVRYLHDYPGVMRRAVLVAPMLGIQLKPLTPGLARLIAGAARRLGWGERYALGQGPYREVKRLAEAGILSSDPERLADEVEACRANPDLALGGVTYGWIAAALESLRLVHGAGYPEAIRTPMLITLAGADRVVDNSAARRFAARLPCARLVEIADARHEILKECDIFRSRFWAAFDQFMAAPAGGDEKK